MRRLILSILSLLACIVYAADYCATASWGYAGGNVTGGGNATPTLVASESQLSTALNKAGSVIIITQDITVSNHISSDKSNLTIMALPGKKLISNDQTQATSGILYLKGNNLLLRNLTLVGPGAYDCNGWDLLCLDRATNVWVDHCDFQDGCDGNFDIKSLSDNITVTWCRFRYLKTPKAGGLETDDHRFSNLVGSGSTDKPSDEVYNITYGFCWWDQGCKQRMARCRNCLIHYLNCYWNSSVADYYIGPENASCYFEGCTFEGSANSASKIWKPFNNSTNYYNFVNCSGNTPTANSTSVTAPAYAYDHMASADAKAMVTNSTCGAGATLTVTTGAKVSSSCDNGQTDPTDPIVVSGDCCVDLSLGVEPTHTNGGIPSDFSRLSVYAYLAKGIWDAGFLNMGGNADYITFDFSAYDAVIEAVEFDVTIPNWAEGKNTVAYHWNTNSNTLYNISSSATEMVALTAPDNATSFTIQRSAGTSTRISQCCFQIKANTTDIGNSPYGDTRKHTYKILRNGVLFIVRDGREYSVLGF